MASIDKSVSENVVNLSESLDNDENLIALQDRTAEGVMLNGVLLKSRIAEGGMGTVYKGWHTRLGIPVAVKILKQGCDSDRASFLREARLMVSIDHPNLVRLFDINVDVKSGLHFMFMEYVEGCSAYQLLERNLKRNFRPLHEVAALEIIYATALALGAAHAKNVVHRDVKSDNILIRSKDGEVKLTDLGLAGIFHSSPHAANTRHSTMAGTIGFISPEIAAGEAITPSADVYGLGATAYELLTGTLPHGAPFDDSYYQRQLNEDPIDPRKLVPELHEDVCVFLSRCLARNPADRFKNGNEVAQALEPLLHSLAGRRRTSTIHEVRKPVVLCVDDDQAILDLERDILESENYEVVCFTDPKEAVANLSAIKPDVCLIDFNMPGMNGIELCQHIRATEGFSDVGVLILSGEGADTTMDSAFQKGITDYLLKPLNLQELVMRINLLTQLRMMNNQKKMLETQLLKIKRVASRTQFKTDSTREKKADAAGIEKH